MIWVDTDMLCDSMHANKQQKAKAECISMHLKVTFRDIETFPGRHVGEPTPSLHIFNQPSSHGEENKPMPQE